MRTRHRRGLATAASVVALVSAGMAAGPSAQASGTGTACPSDRLCFYFNSDWGGARADYAYSDASLNDELFTDGPSGRNGWGVQVENNAASVKNRTGHQVMLYRDRYCNISGSDSYRLIEPGANVNLGANLKNQVSSFAIFDRPNPDCVVRDQSWA